jgi:glucose-6-phosphate isomerase
VLGGTEPRRDKLAIVDDGSGLVGFGDWAEQLIAESTGKLGTGILPVAVPSTQSPEVRWPAPDVLVARLVGSGPGGQGEAPESARPEVRVSGRLGAQFVLWETAVAVAGRLLGINPFDQPDVESAKKAARGLLDAQPDPEDPAFVDDGIEVRATPGLLDGATTVAEAVNALTASLSAEGYLAVMAFLDREGNAELADVRDPLTLRTERPVTFGWGPRFLHSTGQYHKGGPPQGVYLQVTAAAERDLEVPDRPFTFGRLIAAQAAGDAQVLAEHGRPVLRLHLTDRATQLSRLVALLGSPVRDR